MDRDVIAAKLELAEVSKELKETINDIRNTIFNLRPMAFDDLGIQDAFERLRLRLEEISDMKITFRIDEIHSSNQLFLMTIFRIINECVTNSVKHSQGNTLDVELKEKDQIIFISVCDDGKGFDYEKIKDGKSGHYGMLLLKERINSLSGKLQIESGQEGTKVLIIVPLNEIKQEEVYD